MNEIIIANLTLDTYRRNKILPLIVPQGDYGARAIRARITEQGNPINVDVASGVSIIAQRSVDGESLAFSGKANEDGTVNAPITQWMLDVPSEEVICHIVVTGEGYQYSTNSFVIVPQPKINPTDIAEDDPRVDVITEVLANEKARQHAEEERISAEQIRENNEEERISAEQIRENNEEERISAEQTRQFNENQRVEAELLRETTFAEWETEWEKNNINLVSQRVSRNEKRITNLERGLTPSPFVTDDSASYSKSVPLNALPYAEVAKIGGLTRKCANFYVPPADDIVIVQNGVTVTIGKAGFVKLSGICSKNFAFNLGTYTIPKNGYYYFNIPEQLGRAGYLLINGVSMHPSDAYYREMTTTSISLDLVIYTSTTDLNITMYPMINEGTTALHYEPYFEGLRSAPVTEIESVVDGVDVRHVLTIPETVRTLEGYGESNPDNSEEYNYVDFTERKYIARGRIVDGQWMAYENAREIDLTDILPADNYIEVEGGGVLTFENEYRYNVPSEVTYQIKEASE